MDDVHREESKRRGRYARELRARLGAVDIDHVYRSRLRMKIREAEFGLDSGGQSWDDLYAEIAELEGSSGNVT